MLTNEQAHVLEEKEFSMMERWVTCMSAPMVESLHGSRVNRIPPSLTKFRSFFSMMVGGMSPRATVMMAEKPVGNASTYCRFFSKQQDYGETLQKKAKNSLGRRGRRRKRPRLVDANSR